MYIHTVNVFGGNRATLSVLYQQLSLLLNRLDPNKASLSLLALEKFGLSILYVQVYG